MRLKKIFLILFIFIPAMLIAICYYDRLNVHILLKDDYMETKYFVSNNYNDKKDTVFIISGIHGNEVAGIYASDKIIASPNLMIKKFNYVILPKANKEAFENKTRVYNMKDLNRAFPGDVAGKREAVLANEIFSLIEFYKPIIVFDLHESYGKWDKDINAIPNTFIIEDTKLNFDLALHLMENKEGFYILSSPPKGSLNFEVYNKMKIPVVTIETSMEEELDTRVKKHIEMIKYTLEFYK